jgi:hypothetical protein
MVDGKLHLQTVDGMRSLCEQMKILINGCEPIAVTVSGKHIRMRSGTDGAASPIFFEATSQRVTRAGPDGATVVLDGDAHVVYARKGKKIDVSADRISVNLVTGQLVIETEPTPPITVQPCCTTGSATVPPTASCKPPAPALTTTY